MKSGAFRYHAPTSLPEVTALLAEHEDSRVIAGGQSLVAMMALRLARVDHLVDLARVDGLSGVRKRGDEVWIGAMTRQSVLERDADAERLAPLFAAATPHIGHFQIRNRGTVGGSLAHADPAAEYPAVALALDATVEVTGPDGDRSTPAGSFYRSMWVTSLEQGEVVTGIRFTPWAPSTRVGVSELARRHGDFAVVGAVAAVELSPDGRVERAAVSMFGVGTTPQRAVGVEQAMAGAPFEHTTIRDVSQEAVHGLEPFEDVHASARYRIRVAPVVVERALLDAWGKGPGHG